MRSSNSAVGVAGEGSSTSRFAGRVDAYAASSAFRVQVALLMAAVSLIGAFVSFTAAERTSDASHLTALASQQYSEEQQVDQQIEAVIAQDQRTLVRAEPEWRAYQEAIRAADAVRAADPVLAARLDMESQAAFARYAQIYSFFRQGLPTQTSETLVSDPETVRAELEVYDARLFRGSSTLTRSEAVAAASRASGTVGAGILLVGALLLLTLGHVAGGRGGVAFAFAGAALALGATVWFIVLNIGAAQWLLGFAAATLLVVLITRVPRVQAGLAGLERHSSLVSALASAARADPMANASPEGPSNAEFERFIAVAIAAATLLGATVGFMQAQASRAAEEEGWRAQDSGVRAIGALRSAEEDFALQLDQYEQAMILAADAWSARQEAAFVHYSGRSAEASTLDAVAERREAAWRHQVELSDLATELGTNGVVGRAELRPYYAEVWRDAATLVGIQDAANSASETWGARGSAYLAVLSWLAVAVYLLGLSITFRAPVARRVLTGVGLILIVLAAIYAAKTASDARPPSQDVVEQAAEAYAAGFVLASASDPVGAVAEYTKAVELRPDFGIASRDLAQAIMETGSAEGVGFRASFTESAVNDAIAALEAARANRADTAGVLLNLGAMLFHRSIQTQSQDDMEESLSMTRRGLELGGQYTRSHTTHHWNELIGRMNLALALAGTGRWDHAADEYRAVGALIHELQPGRRPLLVSVALVPLDLLRKAPEPPSEDQIVELKELVVSTAYGVDRSTDTDAVQPSVELFPATVQWRATIPGFDPENDRLIAQWYRFDPVLEEWSAVPLLSGSLTLDQYTEAGQFHRLPETDGYWGNTNALMYDEPRSCVQAGRYRLELYLNGRLANSAEGTHDEEYMPLTAQDIGFAMCRPPDWVEARTPGWSVGVTSPDGSRGVVALRLLQSRNVPWPQNDAIAVARAATLAGVGLPEGIGQEVMTEPSGSGASVIGTLPIWHTHSYPGGVVRLAAVPLGDGSEIVVGMYGPADWVSTLEAGAIATSVMLTTAPRYLTG